MKMRSWLLIFSFVAGSGSVPAQATAPPWVPSEGVGNVHMPISCSKVQKEFDRGLALLYSFWYDRAVLVFDDVIAADPQCRIAYWGAAMTYNHPLWAPPTSDDVSAAMKYLKRGSAASEYNDREAGYFHAVTTLYGEGMPATKDRRDVQYMNEMAQLYAKYPDDDTALFYALSIEGSPRYSADPAKIEKAGSLAGIVRKHQPNHPGALHYTIHAYDEPGYEVRALSAARAYAASAPAIPHALHMPSHTFIALGLWDESNETNARAWAADDASIKAAGQPDYDRDFHTLYFYEYGELQAGHFAKAKQLRDIALAEYSEILRAYRTMPREKAGETYDADEVASTIANYAYETGDFSAVDVLNADGLYSVSQASQLEAHAFRALFAHDLEKAQTYSKELQKYVAGMNPPDYSANEKRYASIAVNEVRGSIAISRGNAQAGLAFLGQAADDESHVRTVYQPIIIPPAHELYAKELMRAGRYAEAAANYRIALQEMPNRPMAVLGLAQASSELNDTATKNAMMTKFSQIWSTADRSATAALSDGTPH